MDYFIQDGELVSTKKGMQVSKSLHNGTRFVNSVPQSTKPRAKAKATTKTAAGASSSSSSSPSMDTAAGTFSVFSLSASAVTAQVPVPPAIEAKLSKAVPELLSPALATSIFAKDVVEAPRAPHFQPHIQIQSQSQSQTQTQIQIQTRQEPLEERQSRPTAVVAPAAAVTAVPGTCKAISTVPINKAAVAATAATKAKATTMATATATPDKAVPRTRTKRADTTTKKPAKQKKAAADMQLQVMQQQNRKYVNLHSGFSSFSVTLPSQHGQSGRHTAKDGKHSKAHKTKDHSSSQQYYHQVLENLLQARLIDHLPPFNPFATGAGVGAGVAVGLAAGLGACPTPSMYHAPSWKSLPVHAKASDNHKILFQLYLASMPISMYPMEEILTHNPMRSPDFFAGVAKDLGKLHTVVISSVLVEMHCRGMNPPQALTSLAFYLSRMCALVSEGLKEGDEAAVRARPYVLECIASMAIIGRYTGHYEDWHIHMNGLKKLVASHGGIGSNMDWYLLHKLRRSDTMGAATTGNMPYMDYPRLYPDISTALPLPLREKFCVVVDTCMTAAGVLPCVSRAVQNLVVFTAAIAAARKAPNHSMRFDPHSFVDEWFFVIFELVRYPYSLRDHCTFSQNQAVGIMLPPIHTPESSPPPLAEPDAVPAESTTTVSRSIAVAPEDFGPPQDPPESVSYLDLVSPVPRLASLLFLHEFLPEKPQAPTGHVTPLNLLRDQIQAIVNYINTRRAHPLRPSPPGSPGAPPALPAVYLARPVLIWGCVIGYIYNFRFNASGHIVAAPMQPAPERAIFCECVSLLFEGPTDAPTADDFVMLDVMQWQVISHTLLPSDAAGFVALMRAEHAAGVAAMGPRLAGPEMALPVRTVPVESVI